MERKPDASEAKKWATMIKRLAQPDDPDLRTYSIEQIDHAYMYMIEHGLSVYDIENIMFPGLIASITDNRLGIASGIINDIKKLMPDRDAQPQKPPQGW